MAKRIGTLILCLLLTTISVHGQETYVLPDNLQPITPENAAQLTVLAQLGSATPLGITWSPDGQTLTAWTSDGDYLFHYPDLTNPELVEHPVPPPNQYFSADGSVLLTYEG